MEDLETLLASIKGTEDCAISPPSGIPAVSPSDMLPEDLRRFYALAGGATLYADSVYSYSILPPERIVRANPVIPGVEDENDISAHWYLIADDGNGDYLCIDLHPARAGRCYDAFHETYGLIGKCQLSPARSRSCWRVCTLIRAIIRSGLRKDFRPSALPMTQSFPHRRDDCIG